MNHRELILSARKRAKFAFLALPEDLQDRIVEGLDSQTLTLERARDAVKEAGFQLSHEAIASYMRAVRRERRLYDATQELSRTVEQFQGESLEENAKVLANFMIATAVQKMADGEVGFKDIDLGKVLQALSRRALPVAPEPGSTPAEAPGAGGQTGEAKKELSSEIIEKIRRDVYGIL